MNGVRDGKLSEAGKQYAGQLYLRPHKPVGKGYTAVARRTAQDAALPKGCSAVYFSLFLWWTLH